MQAVTSSVRPHGQTSKSDARSRRVKIMSAFRAHSVQDADTNVQHWTQTASRTGLCTCDALPSSVCPCRRRVGFVGNHSPSVRCTDRAMPARHELIARATTIRPSGASCSVRARTVNQHVCFGQTAFLPTAARKVNASATDYAFAEKRRVSSAKSAADRPGPPRRLLTNRCPRP